MAAPSGKADRHRLELMGTDYLVFVMWLLVGFGLKRYVGTANDANFRELNRKFSF